MAYWNSDGFLKTGMTSPGAYTRAKNGQKDLYTTRSILIGFSITRFVVYATLLFSLI
jgi:hypothetical protein